MGSIEGYKFLSKASKPLFKVFLEKNTHFAMADKEYAHFHFFHPKMPYFALICVGLTTHFLMVVSLKGFKFKVIVIRYEPMLLFYQINISLIRLNTEKTGSISLCHLL